MSSEIRTNTVNRKIIFKTSYKNKKKQHDLNYIHKASKYKSITFGWYKPCNNKRYTKVHSADHGKRTKHIKQCTEKQFNRCILSNKTVRKYQTIIVRLSTRPQTVINPDNANVFGDSGLMVPSSTNLL